MECVAQSWNEVVRSLRDRDLLSNEEVSLLVFQRLKGAAVDAFFGGVVSAGNGEAYLLFPAMLAAPVSPSMGPRNVNTTYSMLDTVIAQVSGRLFVHLRVGPLRVRDDSPHYACCHAQVHVRSHQLRGGAATGVGGG